MLPRRLLTAAEVAQVLGRSVSWFSRNRGRLEAEHDFPRAVAGCGLRWDGQAVARWIDRQAAGEAAPDHSAELVARAERMARGL